MKVGSILSLILMSATVGCSSPGRLLAKVCRESARIEIHDPAGWTRYLAAAQAVDLETQQSIAQGRLSGQIKAPPDLATFIRPFPYVAGYELVRQDENAAEQPQPGNTPGANPITVMRAGKPIATAHDFQTSSASFGYTDFPSCSRDHPEVFGLQRTVVDEK